MADRFFPNQMPDCGAEETSSYSLDKLLSLPQSALFDKLKSAALNAEKGEGGSSVREENFLSRLNGFTRCCEIENNKNKLRRKVQELNSRSDDVKGDSERQRGKKLKKETELWLSNVEKMEEEVQNLDREVAENRNIIKRICLGKRVAEKLEEVEDLYEKGKFPDGLFADDDAGETGPASEEVKETTETGSNVLNNDGGKILISGIGGVGSTDIKIEGETSLSYGDIRMDSEDRRRRL